MRGRAIEFSDADKKYLIDNFKKISHAKLGIIFGCSACSIRNFYVRIGLTKGKISGDNTHEEIKNSDVKTPCKCPRCEKKYDKKLSYEWKGSLPARLNCDNCKEVLRGVHHSGASVY